MRPVAPDGLPVLDVVPGTSNVYVASGYSMLGMTLAAPAGELLAQMVCTGQRPAQLTPFSIGRFGVW
jgi:D-amino-acid dehydrogenase